ncbi:MAG: hypothetical protein HRU19_04510 [Pseudobacteriovorax sp.]|nr:hypothetical protein [Pseudobacteriovorax sp.]
MNKLLVVGLAFMASVALSFGSNHSTLDSKSDVKPNGDVSLTFKIAANKGMQLTHQAPWSISFETMDGLEIEGAKDGKYTSKAYDDALPGFTVKAKAKAQSGKVSYKMRAFVCTEDKSRCFPQTHKGELTWKRS